MIKLNTQWLALPLMLWAAWLFFEGLGTWIHYWGTSDIGPMIGFHALFNGTTQGAVILGIAALVYFAFRNITITITLSSK